MATMRPERRCWKISAVVIATMVATATVIGCGGSGGSPDAATGGGGNGGSSSGGAGGAGNVGGQGGGAGTGVGTDDRLLPLEAGRDWMFQQSPIDSTRASNCSRAEASVNGTVVDGNDSGWVYRPTCSDQSFDVFMAADDVWAFPTGNHDAAQRIQYASAPVQEGATWTSGAQTFTWHDAGAVQTPAGRFERCWQRMAQSDGFIILCRGVGLVVSESTSGNYRLELAAKNF